MSKKKRIILTFFNKKNIFLLLVVFLLGFLLASNFKKVSLKETLVIDDEIPLPEGGEIGGYIQRQLVDLDGDGKKEAVVLYHDKGDESKIYKVYFVIYKLEGGAWQKLIEEEIEGYGLWEEGGSPTETGKILKQFELVDLTGDGLPDVLGKSRAQGSGAFLGIFVYGIKKGKIDLLFLRGPVPKGEVGVEEDKLWLIEPFYQESDPGCCPSYWVKTWWRYNGDEFVELGDFKGSELEKVKETKYSSQLKIRDGMIEGSLSYPSEGIPPDMEICAENLEAGKWYCTQEHLNNQKYTYGVGYKLEVPAGDYYVFALASQLSDYKAYYSEFVTCGLSINCSSHEPILVKVLAGETISGIDPQDWYK